MTLESKLLDAVIERGSKEDLEAWAGSGRAGILELRAALEDSRGRWPGVHPKDEIDFLNEATAAIAASHPDDFLDVFKDRKFDRDGFVLTGLGRIDDQRATDRLVAAAMSGGMFTRMYAAIGLGRRPAENAIGALLALLNDRAFLVRSHTISSLGAIGDVEALGALKAFRDDPATTERDEADGAIRLIERRLRSKSTRKLTRVRHSTCTDPD